MVGTSLASVWSQLDGSARRSVGRDRLDLMTADPASKSLYSFTHGKNSLLVRRYGQEARTLADWTKVRRLRRGLVSYGVVCGWLWKGDWVVRGILWCFIDWLKSGTVRFILSKVFELLG